MQWSFYYAIMACILIAPHIQKKYAYISGAIMMITALLAPWVQYGLGL